MSGNTSGLSLSIPVGSIYFSDGSGITFGSSTAGSTTTVTASFHEFGSLAFSDASGIAWSVATATGDNSTVYGSINQAYYLSGNTSGTTSFSAGSALSLYGGSNITLSGASNNQIVVIGGGGTGGGAFTFNGTGDVVSLGVDASMSSTVNASTITLGLASNISTAWSALSRVQQINGSSGSISFATGSSLSSSANASGITFGLASNISTAWSATASRVQQVNGSSGSLSISAFGGPITVQNSGSTIRLSVANTVAQSQQPMYYSANASSSSNTLRFSNTNGVTFSLSNGQIIGSIVTNYMSSSEPHIRAFGNTASSNAFTSGSVMLSGVNLTVNTSSTGASQYMQISGPAIGYLYFSNANGHSWSSSVSSVSTSIYLVTA
jgi:hypothetical protein